MYSILVFCLSLYIVSTSSGTIAYTVASVFSAASGLELGRDVMLRLSLSEVLPIFYNISGNGSSYFHEHTNQTQVVSAYIEH